MRIFAVAALAFSVFAFTACAGVVSPVGLGALFTSVKGPWVATDADVTSKRGEACASNILGIVATGDASIDSAKRNGGIQKVSAVDHDSLSVLFLYSRFCTIVRGS